MSKIKSSKLPDDIFDINNYTVPNPQFYYDNCQDITVPIFNGDNCQDKTVPIFNGDNCEVTYPYPNTYVLVDDQTLKELRYLADKSKTLGTTIIKRLIHKAYRKQLHHEKLKRLKEYNDKK